MKAITELENLGYVFSTNNDNEAKISFQYTGEGEPDPEKVDPLFAELKANRQELLTYLKVRVAGEQNNDQTEEVDFQAEAARIQAVLKEHGTARLYSKTLGEEVWWTRDSKAARQAPIGTGVYTLDELRGLASDNKMTKEVLKQLHTVKKIFKGTVECDVKSPFTC